MKIIFLDIDGVLNHEQMAEQLDEQHRKRGCTNRYANRESGHCDCYALENQIDPVCVARLNALIERTGALVVVSSSWRKLLAISEIERILVKHGFAGTIISTTPDLPNEPEWLARKRAESKIYYDHIERGHEIEDWILRNEGESGGWIPPVRIDAFCILDDCADMARVKSCLVQTDDRVGLTDRDIVLAEAVMARSGKVLAEIREEAA